MGEPGRRTLHEILRLLNSGTLTSTQLVTESINRADELDRLGAFQVRFDEAALAAAAEVDARRANGCAVGSLAGVPIGVKELLATDDGPTTGGSLVLDPEWGSAGDGTAVARLRAAGAIVLGKTTTSELGMGSPDLGNPRFERFPVPRNPWDESRWTGGSSAGTAAAIAAGIVTAGVGTDSGGSIRAPSAFCGVTGLKPTYGLVPKDGVVPMGWTTDHVGPMAVSARDCALLLQTMAGNSPADPASAPRGGTDYLGALSESISGVRIGVDRMRRIGGPVEHPDQPALFDAAADTLAELGAELIDIELPHYSQLVSAAIVTTLSEALAYHGSDLAQRWEDFFPNTRDTIGLAAYFTGADYVQAQRLRRLVRQEVAALFETIDIVAMPSASIVATPYERINQHFESGEFFAIYATYWNMLGNPAVSVPIGFTSENLPVGMQLVGPRFGDAETLRAGDAYQQVTSWHLRRPPLAGER
jgi:aspartyl-tRNA(Asn)/glutamyl-tRNA(Gln) amidotransferase subunit A